MLVHTDRTHLAAGTAWLLGALVFEVLERSVEEDPHAPARGQGLRSEPPQGRKRGARVVFARTTG